MRRFQGYMTTSGVLNTHYNLIDTMRVFMPNWDIYVRTIISLVEIDYSIYLVYEGDTILINKSAIQDLAQSPLVQKCIPYDIQVRYSICECVVWSYLNDGYGIV